jgi:hypothetical protein
MSKTKIELPKLTEAQIEQIQTLHAQGESVKAIAAQTGVRYDVVYFYAVNKGVPAEADYSYYYEPVLCWCGKRQYAKHLCARHYWQARRQIRRSLHLMAAR